MTNLSLTSLVPKLPHQPWYKWQGEIFASYDYICTDLFSNYFISPGRFVRGMTLSPTQNLCSHWFALIHRIWIKVTCARGSFLGQSFKSQFATGFLSLFLAPGDQKYSKLESGCSAMHPEWGSGKQRPRWLTVNLHHEWYKPAYFCFYFFTITSFNHMLNYNLT